MKQLSIDWEIIFKTLTSMTDEYAKLLGDDCAYFYNTHDNGCTG